MILLDGKFDGTLKRVYTCFASLVYILCKVQLCLFKGCESYAYSKI